MTKSVLQITLFLLLFVSGYFAIKGLFQKEPEKQIIVHSDTTRVIVHDTLWYHLAGSIKKTDSTFIAVPAQVDTALILKRYFAKYAFTDSLKDSNLVAVIADTVCENRIAARNFTYRILRPQVIENIVNNTVATNAKPGLYLGGFLSGNKTSLSLGPELYLLTDKSLCGAGYDCRQKTVMVHLSIRLFK